MRVSELVAGSVLVVGAVAWSVCAAFVSGAPERRDPLRIGAGVVLRGHDRRSAAIVIGRGRTGLGSSGHTNRG